MTEPERYSGEETKAQQLNPNFNEQLQEVRLARTHAVALAIWASLSVLALLLGGHPGPPQVEQPQVGHADVDQRLTQAQPHPRCSTQGERAPTSSASLRRSGPFSLSGGGGI